jgi:methionyl-tRNA formyltransferase
MIFKQIESGQQIEKDKVLNDIFDKNIFRPEFVNRFDATVIFHPLTKDNLMQIAQLSLQSLQKNLKEKDIDFIVSVYWPWLINDLYLAESKDSLNFHPALLPKNRGWYPHVHNLINDTPAGVTLHRMSSVADAGDIWGQKVTFVNDTDNAKDLYERLKLDIYILFSEIWPKIIQGLVVPFKQDEKNLLITKKRFR